jgi:hypothetical protein
MNEEFDGLRVFALATNGLFAFAIVIGVVYALMGLPTSGQNAGVYDTATEYSHFTLGGGLAIFGALGCLVAGGVRILIEMNRHLSTPRSENE